MLNYFRRSIPIKQRQGRERQQDGFEAKTTLQSLNVPYMSPPSDLRKSDNFKVRQSLRTKAIGVCNDKIAKKGEAVGLSFYAFFANKNDDPELLMEAAEWWIKTHQLDHFEKAVKIREMISSGV